MVRAAAHLLRFGHLRMGGEDRQRLIVVGSAAESERVLKLLQRAGVNRNLIGRVGIQKGETDSIGSADQLPELVRLYRAEELIFCSADLPHTRIQAWMAQLGPQVYYKMLPESSSSIIGSHRSDRRGELYTIDVNLRIDEPTQRRSKWLFNKFVALLLFVSWPLSMFIVGDKIGLLVNAFRVMKGELGWVGYDPRDPQEHLLPKINRGVVTPAVDQDVSNLEPDALHHLNLLYARDYRVADDLRLVWEQRVLLGQ
jgi:hypothetical protein